VATALECKGRDAGGVSILKPLFTLIKSTTRVVGRTTAYPSRSINMAEGWNVRDLTAVSDCQLAALQMESVDSNPTGWKLCEQEITRRQGMPPGQRRWVAIWIFMGALVLSAFVLAIVLPKQVLAG
jgi:hypothetical protein